MILIFGKKYDVIVLGSLSIDNFVALNSINQQLKPGSKILINNYITEIGGGGGNSSISLANFGLKVKLISKIGSDNSSSYIKHRLSSKKVFYNTKPSEKIPTAFSIILVGKKEQDRVALSHKGASDYLTKSDIMLSELSSGWLYLGTLLGESFKTAEFVASECYKRRIKILFNPSTYLASKGKKHLAKILRITNILILNNEEAQLVLGKKLNVHQMLFELRKLGPEIVIITNAAKNIYAIDGKCTYSLKPYKTKIVSTLGAGDAFSSGFLASFIISNNIEKSLRIGAANASSVLGNYGATVGLINYIEAASYIKKHRTKLEEKCDVKW